MSNIYFNDFYNFNLYIILFVNKLFKKIKKINEKI